jgi:hypothetical protein
MSYIGNSLTQQSFTGGMDQFNGNASNTTFGLSRPINTNFDIDVYVESVYQRPGVGYNVSANTITFTSAPSAGSNNVVVVYKNFTATSIVPIPGSVTPISLAANTIPAALGYTPANKAGDTFTGLVQSNTGFRTTVANTSISSFNGRTFINTNATGDSEIGGGTGSNFTDLMVNGSAVARLSPTTLTLNSGQIKFPATQVASSDANTLDDYEEGSWTPAFGSDGTAPTMTYGSNSGQYVKIGRFVLVQWQVYVSTYNGNGSGNLTLTGLPFVPNNAGGISIASTAYWTTAPAAGELAVSLATIYLVKSLQNNTRSVVADLYTGTNSAFNYFRGTACYWTTA